MTEPISGEDKSIAVDAAMTTDVALVEPTDKSAPLVSPVGESRAPSLTLKRLSDLLHDFAIAVVICVLLIAYVVQAFRVQGMSMAPELTDGERILVNKFVYHFSEIQRGDVVVFWYPEDPDVSFIKRVVALPQDRVEIVQGRVSVNGEPLSESYVKVENADDRNYPRKQVRSGHYFVLGDNRQGSNDSRTWGFVPRRYIYGKAFLRLWPLTKIGVID